MNTIAQSLLSLLSCVGKKKVKLRKEDVGRIDTNGKIGLKGTTFAQLNDKD